MDGEALHLTEEIRSLTRREGAFLVGIASTDRFDGAPRGHHPTQIVKGAHSVISFGVPLVEPISDWEKLFTDSEILAPDMRGTMLDGYLYSECNYNFINDRLNQIALRLTLYLQDEGFCSIFFPATYGAAHRHLQDMMPSWMGLFSQRHAAVRAGLGEFGLNNVVVTSEYGPRIRFNSVITQAPLAPTPLLSRKACLGTSCSLCIDKCGPQALTISPGFDEEAVWLNPVSRTDMPLCRAKRSEMFCRGRCLQVCPVGRRTSSSE